MEHSFQESLFQPLPSADELRRALKEADGKSTRELLAHLFDEDTFVELGVYTKRSFSEYATLGRTIEFEGVICGYGAISGVLVYAFAQDFSRMKGAIDEMHARKICELYDLAMKSGSPVIGIFDSAGADIYEGVSALSAYGRIMKKVAGASGAIPQIALIKGHCIGTAAAIAAMFDFSVITEDATFYVSSPEFGGENENTDMLCAYRVPDAISAADTVRKILYYLPSCAGDGIRAEATPDDPGRMLGELDIDADAHALLCAIADNGIYTELYSKLAFEAVTAFAVIGGIRCGIVAVCSADGGRLSELAAKKISRFVSFLDAFSIPLLTFVDSKGFVPEKPQSGNSFAADIARLASAYAVSDMPKVTVILGHAIGGAYTVLGSKSIGADVTFALDSAEIGTLPADASVAFAWNDRITTDTTRSELEETWLRSMSSPVAAASKGEIDDIITVSELRMRVCSALMMLTANGSIRKKRSIAPF